MGTKRSLLELECQICTGERSQDINSGPGRLLVALCYFSFVGIVTLALILGFEAQRQFRRGRTNINPRAWTATGFLILLLLALVRSCI